jgi:hypothetical protein
LYSYLLNILSNNISQADILSICHHPNIIRFVEFYILSKEWVLISERVLLICFGLNNILHFSPLHQVEGLELQEVIDRYVDEHKKSFSEVYYLAFVSFHLPYL